jgi:putative membrane protein
VTYAVFKALHLFGAFAWMAAAWYLPRLLIYRCEFAENYGLNDEKIVIFDIMAGRLLRYILMPAMIYTVVVGLVLVWGNGLPVQLWLSIKLVFIAIFIGYSLLLARLCQFFKQGRHVISKRGLRWLNEVPTLILIAILTFTIVYRLI